MCWQPQPSQQRFEVRRQRGGGGRHAPQIAPFLGPGWARSCPHPAGAAPPSIGSTDGILVVGGPSGTGKTFLLEALGHTLSNTDETSPRRWRGGSIRDAHAGRSR